MFDEGGGGGDLNHLQITSQRSNNFGMGDTTSYFWIKDILGTIK